MSKNHWILAGSVAILVVLLAFFAGSQLLNHPSTASESDIPFGFFDGSGSFGDSLLASSQLAAAGSAFASPTPTGLDGAKDSLKGVLVNIICAAKDGSVRSISGSGVIISADGLIITNSHIAQFFLLKDYPTKENVLCVVRTGNPARTAYFADVVYVSSVWIDKNASSLVETNPRGSGENDFALLSITRSATKTKLPDMFPHLTLTDSIPTTNQEVTIGSYGAQDLTTEQIQYALAPTIVSGSVKDYYTFESGTENIDLLSLGGSAAAQHGSSGGGVLNSDGKFMALITTSSGSGPVATRELRAITVEHIRRSFEEDTGTSFDMFLTTHKSDSVASTFSTQLAKVRTSFTAKLSSLLALAGKR